ncbi:MAG: hypothetical protein NT126_07390 [Bacteroidetes bacterium]|nr:hypothetical protein [Bacteroidota bacterium]
MPKKNNYLIDIVNLNADASCLSSKWWLKMLKGKADSYFCNWLKAYIKAGKKVSLGITGATIADIRMHNPEAIDLINKHRDLFEVILRPFAHDIALLRSKEGFLLNLDAGTKTLKKEFGKFVNYFLPPEFMLTNEQLYLLNRQGVAGTFINASRFKTEIKDRLPDHPYRVKGLMNTEMNCIPFTGALTQAYLHGIHYFNADNWNRLLTKSNEVEFSWRDGESSFFVPDGNKRELAWLKGEDKNVQRLFLSEALGKVEFDNNKNLKENHYHYYPVHSFTAWMKEFRMIGFIQKIVQAEMQLEDFTKEQKSTWLQVINSDILSSIEKDSPRIKIMLKEEDSASSDYTIWRCERGVEGEEFLSILTGNVNKQEAKQYVEKSDVHHILKLKGRQKYLEGIL